MPFTHWRLTFSSPSTLWLAVLIISMYLPTVVSPYQRHDDYYLNTLPPTMSFTAGQQLEPLITTTLRGRPILAQIQFGFLAPLYTHFQQLEFFVILRAWNLGMVALFALLLYRWLTKQQLLTAGPALFTALGWAGLPGCQFLVAQGLAASNSFCLPLALLAGLLILESERTPGTILKKLLRNFSSVLILIFILFTYQTHALLFFLPFTFQILFLNAPNTNEIIKENGIRHLFVFLLAWLCYWSLYQQWIIPQLYLAHPELTQKPWGGAYLTRDPLMLWNNLATNLLNHKALNLWILTPLPIGIFFLLSGAAAYFTRRQKLTNQRDRIDPLTFLISLSFLIILSLSQQIFWRPFNYYRVLIAYQSLLGAILLHLNLPFISILFNRFSNRSRNILLLMIAGTFCVLIQQSGWRGFVQPARQEFAAIGRALAPLRSNHHLAINLIRPRSHSTFFGDEHFAFTSYFQNDYGLHGLVRRALKEKYVNPDDYLITQAAPEQLRVSLKESTVTQEMTIDLNTIFFPHS